MRTLTLPVDLRLRLGLRLGLSLGRGIESVGQRTACAKGSAFALTRAVDRVCLGSSLRALQQRERSRMAVGRRLWCRNTRCNGGPVIVIVCPRQRGRIGQLRQRLRRRR